MKKKKKWYFYVKRPKTKNTMTFRAYSEDGSKLFISFIRRLPQKDCYAHGYIDFLKEQVYLTERRSMTEHDIKFIYKALEPFDYNKSNIFIERI